jgi:uncharacterized protein YdbL (DUF1318 family)
LHDATRRHLLLSFPDPELPFEGMAVVDRMVEGAIHAVLQEKGTGRIILIGDLQERILALADLRYETAELVAAAERLQAAKYLEFRDPRHLSFVFSAERFAELNRKLRQHGERDARVREAWSNEVGRRHDLTEGQLDRLWIGLEQFVAALLSTHAAEAAAFLYQGSDSEQIGFSAALASRYPSLDRFVPADLQDAAREEYPRFFDIGEEARREFLVDRLQAAFVFHLLSIDPQASELVRSNVSEKTLYLDTNFLYRLLGIHGPALTHGPATTLLVSEQLNCRLVVAKETVDEFVRALRSEVNRIRAAPIGRSSYQQIAAAQHASDWAFAQAYYRELTSARVSGIDEFERKYSNVLALVKDWNIQIDEGAVLIDEERADPDFHDLWSALNQWHNNMKGAGTIDHDVFLLRYIRHLRGDADATPGQVKMWLLTYDRGLTAFAAHRARRERLSPCMLGDSWLQLTRPFLPRTEEYERAFVAMLQHPLLSGNREAIPFGHVADALNRLERYRELPPTVVAAMVADGEFHRRLGAARDAEAEKKVVELAVQRLAAEAVNRAEQAESKLTQAMGRIETLETTVGSLKTAKSEAEQDSDEVRRRAEEQEVLFQAEIARVPDQLKAAIEEVVGRVRYENEQTTQTLAAGYNQNLRWILFGSLVAIVTVIFGVSLVLFGSQASSVTYAVTAAWWIITVLTLLAIPFWYRLGAVAAGVSLAIAVLGAIGLTFQLMTAAEGGTIRQSPAPGPRGATPRDSVPAEVPSKSERGGSGRRS